MQHPAIEAVAREAWFKNRQGFGVSNDLSDAFSPISLPSLALIRTTVSFLLHLCPLPDASSTSFFVQSMSGHPGRTTKSSFERKRTRKNTGSNSRMSKSGTALTRTYLRRTGSKCMTTSGALSSFSTLIFSDHPNSVRNLALARGRCPLQPIWTKPTDSKR